MALRTQEINAMLRAKYAAPEWAIFFEVQNGTGAGLSRYADALAMNLFPSRGLELHGFEVKVSKSDWKRELSLPHKAEAHVKNCDRWWIVAPKGIVDKDELPPTWGLIVADDKGLRQAVAAPRLSPDGWSRGFIAAILRRSSEIDHREIDAIVEKRVRYLRARDNEEFENRIKRRTRELQDRVERYEEVERAAGISLTDWTATKERGEIIKLLERAGIVGAFGSLSDAHERLKKACEYLGDAVEKINAISQSEVV